MKDSKIFSISQVFVKKATIIEKKALCLSINQTAVISFRFHWLLNLELEERFNIF